MFSVLLLRIGRIFGHFFFEATRCSLRCLVLVYDVWLMVGSNQDSGRSIAPSYCQSATEILGRVLGRLVQRRVFDKREIKMAGDR